MAVCAGALSAEMGGASGRQTTETEQEEKDCQITVAKSKQVQVTFQQHQAPTNVSGSLNLMCVPIPQALTPLCLVSSVLWSRWTWAGCSPWTTSGSGWPTAGGGMRRGGAGPEHRGRPSGRSYWNTPCTPGRWPAWSSLSPGSS